MLYRDHETRTMLVSRGQTPPAAKKKTERGGVKEEGSSNSEQDSDNGM